MPGDLCQETLLKAYRALGTFKKAGGSRRGYQIALNVCRDRLRRRKSRPSVSLDELLEGARWRRRVVVQPTGDHRSLRPFAHGGGGRVAPPGSARWWC
jgi:DNA-directed RNA polymerase specialized sigma24 family protein